ncbi:MAG TPA: hypothetical protein VEA36_03705 [Candidatus Paceibacterota bacterium]|nr:hypothetical protein [Candidatus Paceibacterota bacterium]
MSDRYDVMSGRNYTDRNGDSKTAWTKVGTMFTTERGFRIALDALPLPQLRDGKLECTLVCFPPKPREEKGGNRGGDDLGGDSIPF